MEGAERDSLEKEEDNDEHERDLGDPDCEGENSMEEKLGLSLGLSIGPPPPSERWLPPSPLYSAPFLNGSPQPSSPQPSLGAQGPLEAPLRSTWLEDELRGLGEAAIQLGNRVEKSLREFSEGFRQDMRTLVTSQETLAVSLQQNNVLLQRLLAVLEAQHQQPQQQQHRAQQAHQSQAPQQHLVSQQARQLQHLDQQQHQQRIEAPLQTHQLQQQQQSHAVQQTSQQHQIQIEEQQPEATHHSKKLSVSAAPSASEITGTFPPDLPTDTNGSLQRPRRGRALDHRRRRRR